MQEGDAEALRLWKLFNDISQPEYERQYKRLGVWFDEFKGESYYNRFRDELVAELTEKGLLVESEGARIVDLEAFKMPPCLILRSDGGALYATRDIPAAIDRFKSHRFDKILYVTDVRQSLHFAQFFKVLELMGYEWASSMEHVPYGVLSLQDGPLSSRYGKIILLTDLIDEGVRRVRAVIDEKNPDLANRDEVAEQVGIGALIFSSLYNSRTKDNVFTLDKALSFEGETGPYAQYTHARACAVLAKSGRRVAAPTGDVDCTLLNEDCVLEIVKLIADFPERVQTAAERNEPFLVARFVIALAQAFNKFYHECPILGAETEGLREARLGLVAAVKAVLADGLGLLGVAAPERM
jgi:arginyl-tRNA synthetase